MRYKDASLYKKVRISEVCDVFDGPHATPKKTMHGPIYLGIDSITDDGRINPAGFNHLSPDDYKLWTKRVIPQENDVVFTYEATIGRYALIPKDFYGCLGRRIGLVRAKDDRINPRWLLYYFLSPEWQRFINSRIVIGSTVNRIPIRSFPDYEINLPSRSAQDQITAILGSIDDLIEKNTQINDNLQQQAFALFDRLLTQAEGRLCCLSEIAELNPKRQLSKGSIARCIDMAQLSTSGAFPSGWKMKPYNGGMRFSNGDTIIARITPCLENGKTAFIDFLDESEVAFGSTEYIVIASRGVYPAEYFYCLARYPAFVDYAVKNMNGSSGRQRVSADILSKYLLPQLPEEEIASFTNTVSSLFQTMRRNSLENIHLTALRDALLPKLMSGEIDVSNVTL